MSRLAKKFINIDSDVNVTKPDHKLVVKGPLGELNIDLHEKIRLTFENQKIIIKPLTAGVDLNLVGLYYTLVENALIGVKKGWSKILEMVGVGFRAETDGSVLTLNLGFSHPVVIKAPAGINFSVQENKITVKGIDKYLVGETAAKLRHVKPPEPYKGKGIRYLGEIIRKKAGKAAKTVGQTLTR